MRLAENCHSKKVARSQEDKLLPRPHHRLDLGSTPLRRLLLEFLGNSVFEDLESLFLGPIRLGVSLEPLCVWPAEKAVLYVQLISARGDARKKARSSEADGVQVGLGMR